MLHPIVGELNTIKTLRGKKATFMLAMSNTATADIPGITQAGIPGLLHLTPVLDAEFLTTGAVHSLENIAETPKGVPTPALITRAVHLLHPFSHIELLDLGLKVTPKTDATIHSFDIAPSGSIAEDAHIDAKTVFEKGLAFGQSYDLQDDYLILAESVPSGTTTATATALALGYDAKGCFSSSFKNVPNDIRQSTIDKARSHIEEDEEIFTKLGKVSDNMLLFVAGFLIGAESRFPILLAGGTQMAAALLVADAIIQHYPQYRPQNTMKPILATTQWVAKDAHSDIATLLAMPHFPVDACYSDFDFAQAAHPALKLYDEGEAKEGVGAGAALSYGILNGLTRKSITIQVEKILN